MSKKYFQIQEGGLSFVFEGTEEELKANFEQEKQSAIAFYEKAIAQYEKNIEKHVRPEKFDSMSDAEKVAVDAQIASNIASEQLKIANIKEKIATVRALNIKDNEYFVLEAVKIQ